MFHSAAVKLTTWYLAIIMALSIGLSLALYKVSNQDLDVNIHRQNSFFNFLPPKDQQILNIQRSNQLEDAETHLRDRLVLFNLVVLLVGGGVSYMLARRTLEPIEQALQGQSRFAGDAAHELRTPLTAMQTEIEVALRNPNLNKVQAVEQLGSNLEELAKLETLSDGLLALVGDRRADDYKAKVSLKKSANQAIKAITKSAEAKKIKIVNQIGELNVKGNQPQIVNLITILLDNAVKYSSDASLVSLAASRNDKLTKLSISDEGIGIKQVELENIFDRFYRADNSRSKLKAEGYGLGLAIAKQIVERHHGYIDVRSQLEKGSTFIVSLPSA